MSSNDWRRAVPFGQQLVQVEFQLAQALAFAIRLAQLLLECSLVLAQGVQLTIEAGVSALQVIELRLVLQPLLLIRRTIPLQALAILGDRLFGQYREASA